MEVVLCISQMHIEEVEVQLQSFLTLALDIGDPTVSLDVSNNRKIYCPCSNSKPLSPTLQPSDNIDGTFRTKL